jgi:hypothetical protein
MHELGNMTKDTLSHRYHCPLTAIIVLSLPCTLLYHTLSLAAIAVFCSSSCVYN